jgi:hypothetical protein
MFWLPFTSPQCRRAWPLLRINRYKGWFQQSFYICSYSYYNVSGSCYRDIAGVINTFLTSCSMLNSLGTW